MRSLRLINLNLKRQKNKQLLGLKKLTKKRNQREKVRKKMIMVMRRMKNLLVRKNLR